MEEKHKTGGYGRERLKEERSPLINRTWIKDDPLMLRGCHMFDKAQVVMLTEQELITKEIAAKLLKALREMEQLGVDKVRPGMHGGEAWITKNPRYGPDVGGWIHIGRSSGDLSVTGYRIALRERLLDLLEAVCELREALLDTAENNLESVMAGYSHNQIAQTLTFGHYLLARVLPHERDFQRLRECYARVNMSPAGSAIMSGTDFAISRERTAELMGFDEVIKNTKDAVFGQDHMLETLAVLAILANNIGKYADDLDWYSGFEFDEVEPADQLSGTSSIMPQKKNPVCFEDFTRGRSGLIFGRLMGALAIDKVGTHAVSPMLMIPPEVLNAIEHTLGSIAVMTQAMKTIKFNKDIAKERVTEDWAQATDLAAALTRERNVPWRLAHHIVGTLVRHAIEEGKLPMETTPEMIDQAAMESIGKPIKWDVNSIRRALDPLESVKRRQITGGPAPNKVAEAIKECRKNLKKDRETVSSLRSKQEEAAEKLETAIDSIIGD